MTTFPLTGHEDCDGFSWLEAVTDKGEWHSTGEWYCPMHDCGGQMPSATGEGASR